jgi:hypothetical protein
LAKLREGNLSFHPKVSRDVSAAKFVKDELDGAHGAEFACTDGAKDFILVAIRTALRSVGGRERAAGLTHALPAVRTN